MEDEVLIREKFTIDASNCVLKGPLSFYGVFDGHGGRHAAIYTREHLLKVIIDELKKGKSPEDALRAAFLAVDQSFIDMCRGSAEKTASPSPPPPSSKDKSQHGTDEKRNASNPPNIPHPIAAVEKDTSGTTAVVALIEHTSKRIWIAHVGDSRAVLINANGKAVGLTSDHKADRPDEVERIRQAGGFVVHKRVMGELAISRAIGDLDFKEKGFLFVLADPEIVERQLTHEDVALVVACDGLYDVMTNDAVGEFIKERFANGLESQTIADQIVRHAIEKLYTRDNVTVIIVKLSTPQTTSHSHSTADSEPSATPTTS
jgi:serine/threonine protein phosphatase PrpC